MKNKLTVIVPVFNTGYNLENCLDSLINQTIRNISIIIVDDCSTDGITKDIINAYSLKYSNISVIRNVNNLGPGLSRNIGMDNADSEYVAFLDSDDWVDLNAYQVCVEFLSKNKECDIAVFDIVTEYNNFNSSKKRYTYNNQIINSSMAIKLLSNSNRFNQTLSPLVGNRVYRSFLLKNNKIKFISGYFEDDYFSFLCFKSAQNLALLSGISLHYYQRENSLMHSFSKKNVEGLFNCFNNLKTRLQKENYFDSNKKSYFSFFERCAKSLFRQLFDVETNTITQKKYLKLFFYLLHKNISIDDYLDYVDVERIKEFFI